MVFVKQSLNHRFSLNLMSLNRDCTVFLNNNIILTCFEKNVILYNFLKLGTDRMLDILHQAQENDVAVSGLWIQDWSGKITTEFGTRFCKN